MTLGAPAQTVSPGLQVIGAAPIGRDIGWVLHPSRDVYEPEFGMAIACPVCIIPPKAPFTLDGFTPRKGTETALMMAHEFASGESSWLDAGRQLWLG